MVKMLAFVTFILHDVELGCIKFFTLELNSTLFNSTLNEVLF